MKHFKILATIMAISIAVVFLQSCEAEKTVQVTVLDKVTQEPIDSVYVQFHAGKNNDYTKSGTSGHTDENGLFIGSFMIGCTFGCYDYYFECIKPGYVNYISEFNVNNETVYLDRE